MYADKQTEEFIHLRQVSAEVGSNSMLVQHAGGNTSIKSDNTMWIKASGTLLAEANSKDIFVPVDLDAMREAIHSDKPEADQPATFLIPGDFTLRPSIETSLHAIFSYKVVLHVHCIHTIVYAIRADRETLLKERLDGIGWALVPYAKPGANLARTVSQKLGKGIKVVILSNHGLIVAGDTVAETKALLYEVHKRLTIRPADEVTADKKGLTAIAAGSQYQLPKDDIAHQLALEQSRVKQCAAGSLYPDHVVFCGMGATVLAEDESPNEVEHRFTSTGAPAPVFLIIPEQGILVRKDASKGSHLMIRCLNEVLMRTPADASLEYLSDAQNFELLHWDAEKYRQRLNAS